MRYMTNITMTLRIKKRFLSISKILITLKIFLLKIKMRRKPKSDSLLFKEKINFQILANESDQGLFDRVFTLKSF